MFFILILFFIDDILFKLPDIYVRLNMGHYIIYIFA